VVRGGSWNNNQNNARAAYRNNNNPDNRNNNNGFRVVGVVHSPPSLLWPGLGSASCTARAARAGQPAQVPAMSADGELADRGEAEEKRRLVWAARMKHGVGQIQRVR
jgi:hypothetical protein